MSSAFIISQSLSKKKKNSNNNNNNNNEKSSNNNRNNKNNNTTTTNTSARKKNKYNKQEVNINNLIFSTSIPSTSTHTDENKLYTVYNILIRIQGYKHIVPKRFSEFQSFSELLKYHFPMARLPKFPSKGGIGGFLTRMDDSTIESRRQNLETYINAAVNNFTISRSHILYHFLDISKAVKEANNQIKLEEERQERYLKEFKLLDASLASNVGHNANINSKKQLSMKFQNRGSNYNTSMYNLDMKKYLYSTSPYALSTSYYIPDHANGGMIREAVKRGDIDTVNNILNENSKLACYIDGSKQSILHLACIFNHVDIAMLLISNGADPEYKNSREETSYDIASDTLTNQIRVLVKELDKDI